MRGATAIAGNILLVAAALSIGALPARAEDAVDRAVRIDEAEQVARRAHGELSRAQDARAAEAQLSNLIDALGRAGLARSATVLLAALATGAASDAGVTREAARAALTRVAQDDPALALLLLSRTPALEDKAPAALRLQLARLHLESALVQAPLEEGTAFVAAADQPGPAKAALEEVAAKAAPEPAPAKPAPEDAAAKAAPEPAPASPAPEPAAPAQDGSAVSRARALAQGLTVEPSFAAEALEVAGLSALAAGDADGARASFLALAARKVGHDDIAAGAIRERALLQLARLAYAQGDDAAAAALYGRVGRGAPEWLDALFESSWSHFRRGDDEKALGNLLTLHAPFFQGRYFPESFVLKALVFYENCRYADARRALAAFERDYRPLLDGLSGALQTVGIAQQATELLLRGKASLQSLPPSARDEIARLLSATELQAAGVSVAELSSELDSLDHRSGAFRGSALVRQLAPLVRQARLELIEATGLRVRGRIARERSDLRELLGQSLRLAYEIAGREKEQAASGAGGLAGLSAERRHLPQVADDEELWPFQGEYWRDELGSYQFSLGERCRKAPTTGERSPSAGGPPSSAAERAPSAAGARPSAAGAASAAGAPPSAVGAPSSAAGGPSSAAGGRSSAASAGVAGER